MIASEFLVQILESSGTLWISSEGMGGDERPRERRISLRNMLHLGVRQDRPAGLDHDKHVNNGSDPGEVRLHRMQRTAGDANEMRKNRPKVEPTPPWVVVAATLRVAAPVVTHESPVRFGPVDVLNRLLDVFRLAVLIVDVEGVLVGDYDDLGYGHPQHADRVFVADHVVELPVDRVLRQHGLERGRERSTLPPHNWPSLLWCRLGNFTLSSCPVFGVHYTGNSRSRQRNRVGQAGPAVDPVF